MDEKTEYKLSVTIRPELCLFSFILISHRQGGDVGAVNWFIGVLSAPCVPKTKPVIES